MKIAQVCPYDFSRPGGVKSHIVSLADQLAKLGHEVKILAPNIGNASIDDPRVHLFGRNRSINLGGTKIDINIALGKERTELKAFLKKENFDIIHFHTFWNPALPFQIRGFSRAKHVTTFHDTPKNQFIGKSIMPLAAKGVFRLMDAIISVSKTQASYINRFSNREISIIPNGIDLETYNQPVEPIKKYQDGKFNLLFLGRLEPRKGLIYALESFKTLKSENDNLRLIIAGDGDERVLAEDFIRKNNLTDVEMLGFVTEEEKRRLLKTADLYLAPALYGESFGIVLLEAMAMGTPMAGFANAGYRNILTEEMLDFFPEPKELNKLIDAIRHLAANPEVREKLIKIGQESVKQYAWKLITGRIVKLYGEVMGEKP